MTKLKLEQLKTQYQTATLQALAERHDLTFMDIYQAFEQAGVTIRKSDLYWREHAFKGQSLKAIAKAYNVDPSAVSHALKAAGYTPQRSRIREPTGEASGRGFVLSQRLRDAVNELGEKALMRGIAYFEKHPDAIVLENIGVGEPQVTREFRDLSAKDVARIQALARSLGKRWGSVVVRNALEYLIATEGLTHLAKPDDWQAKPLPLVLGGRNPVAKLPDLAPAQCFTIPLAVWRRIEHLQTQRGHAHTKQLDLVEFVRTAIDRVDESTLAADRPEKPLKLPTFKTATNFTIRLTTTQAGVVKALQNKLRWNASEVVAAIITQACDTKTVPAAKVKPSLRLTAQQRKVWQAFRKTSSVNLVAHALGLTDAAVEKTLLETRLVEPKRSRPDLTASP